MTDNKNPNSNLGPAIDALPRIINIDADVDIANTLPNWVGKQSLKSLPFVDRYLPFSNLGRNAKLITEIRALVANIVNTKVEITSQKLAITTVTPSVTAITNKFHLLSVVVRCAFSLCTFSFIRSSSFECYSSIIAYFRPLAQYFLIFVGLITSTSAFATNIDLRDLDIIEIPSYKTRKVSLLKSYKKQDFTIHKSSDLKSKNLISHNRITSDQEHLIALIKTLETRYRLPRNLLFAIVKCESDLNPYAINVEGKGYYFKSKKEAVHFAKNLLDQGVTNFDIGLAQINWLYHQKHFRSIEEAFDPKVNLIYASEFLSSLKKLHGSFNKAIRFYHSSNRDLQIAYVRRIMNAWFS